MLNKVPDEFEAYWRRRHKVLCAQLPAFERSKRLQAVMKKSHRLAWRVAAQRTRNRESQIWLRGHDTGYRIAQDELGRIIESQRQEIERLKQQIREGAYEVWAQRDNGG